MNNFIVYLKGGEKIEVLTVQDLIEFISEKSRLKETQLFRFQDVEHDIDLLINTSEVAFVENKKEKISKVEQFREHKEKLFKEIFGDFVRPHVTDSTLIHHIFKPKQYDLILEKFGIQVTNYDYLCDILKVMEDIKDLSEEDKRGSYFEPVRIN